MLTLRHVLFDLRIDERAKVEESMDCRPCKCDNRIVEGCALTYYLDEARN